MQKTLEIAAAYDLALTFGNWGTEIGPRAGPNARTHSQKEWWCLRRYLFTLAGVDRLQFPIRIEKGERPDFRCMFGAHALGIEITTVTTSEDEAEMTKREKLGRASLVGS